MPKPGKTGRENAAERSGGKSEGGGRENAPGQNRNRTFVHQESGDTVTGTMNEFHKVLKDQGYFPADGEPFEEDITEDAVEPTAPSA